MPRKIDAQLHKAFAPIRRRLMVQFFIDAAIGGLIVAIGQCIIWLAVSFFIPIVQIVSKMAYTGGIVILASLVIAWIMRPSVFDMTRKADKLGFQERITTAYEFSELSHEFAKLQRQDTIDRLKVFNPKSINICIPKKSSLMTAGMAIVLIGGFLIPNPQDRVINERLQAKKIIEEQFKRLEKDNRENLSKEVGLTPEEKEEVKKLLAELSTKLKKTQEYREAIKEISKAEEKLIGRIKEARQQKMVTLGEKLSKQEALRPLGEKVKDMDTEGIKQEMEKLQELAKSEALDKEIMKSIQEALEQMAQELGEGKSKDELIRIAKEIDMNSDKKSSNLVETLKGLEAQLAQMSEKPLRDTEELMFALQDMKNRISQADSQNIDKSQHAQSKQSDNQNDGGNNPEDSPGNSQDNSGQFGQGNQSDQWDPGQGNNGKGNSGSGSGCTSTGEGQGAGIGTAHPEYEKILDPKRLGNGGKIGQVKGNINEQGSSQQVDAGQGSGSFDGFIPYNEIFGEYKSQAMQNIDRINIPSNMREWVKGYFSSLE